MSRKTNRTRVKKAIFLSSAAAAVTGLGSAQLASAAVIYWDGSGTLWSNTSSWSTASGATTPNPASVPGSSDIATFNITTVNTAQTVSLNADQSALGLAFNSTGTVALQGGGTNRTLNLGTTGIAVNSGAGAVTIGSATSGQNVAISLQGAQSWTSSGTGVLTINNGVSIGAGGNQTLTLTGTNTGSNTVAGLISNGSSTLSLSKTGAGTWVLSNSSNSYTGTTTISAGTLIAAANNALGSNTGGTTVSSGATLGFQGGITYSTTEALSVTGTGMSSVGAINNVSGTNSFSGAITLTGNTTIGSTAGTLTLNGAIGESGGSRTLDTTGTGTIVLASTTSNYSGLTTIASGSTLIAAANNALGTNAAGTTVNSGGTLGFQGGISYTTTEALTVNGVGVSSVGAINNISGTNSFSGAVTLAGNTTIGATAGTLTLNGAIGESGGARTLATAGAGTLVLANSGNNYSGATTINSGDILIAAANNALGTNAAGTTVSSGATLGFQGGINYATTEALNINGTGVSSAGAINNVSGNNSFAGVITLSGASTINSATSGNTLTLTGGITNGGNLLTISGAGNTTVSSAAITGAGGLTQDGTGILTLSAANSYTGTTSINQGTLIVGADSLNNTNGPLGKATTAIALGVDDSGNPASLLTGGAFTVGRTVAVAHTSSGDTPYFTIGGNTDNNSSFSNTITLDGNLLVSQVATTGTNALTISGDIVGISGSSSARTITFTGSGAIKVTGGIKDVSGARPLGVSTTGGTTTLSGANTYGQATTIGSGSTLIAAVNNAMGTNAAGTTVSSGGTLGFQGGITYSTTEAVGISGTGVSSVGAINNVSGNNSFAGAVTLNAASTINSSTSGNTLTLTGGITNGSNLLTINGTGNTTVSTTKVTGSGGLTKSGTGTLLLSANNDFTGVTTINAGALYINGTTSGQGNYSFGALTAPTTLGGTGTIGLAASKTVTVTGADATNRAILSPGDGTTATATLNVGSASTNTVTLGNFSTLAIDVNGATTDLLHITGALNTTSGSNRLALTMTSPTLGKYKIADYSVSDTYASNTAANGGFAAVTGLDSAYRLNVTTASGAASAGEIDLIHKADQTFSRTAPATPLDAFVSTNVSLSGTLTNSAPSSSDNLVAALTSTGTLTASGLSSSTGSSVTTATPSTITGTIATGASAGLSKSWQVTNTDNSALTTTSTIGGTINVYNHAAGSISGSTLAMQDVIVGYGSTVTSTATRTITNTAATPGGNLKTTGGVLGNISLSNVAAVAAGNGTASLTATLAVGQALGNYSIVPTLTYADDSAYTGGSSSLGTQLVTVSGRIIDHALGTASITSGNNFNAFVNTSGLAGVVNLAAASLSGSNARAGLQVSGTSANLSGGTIGLISAGNSSNYNAGFSSGSTVGTGISVATASFNTGDDQALTGHNSIVNGNITSVFSGNVYDHALVITPAVSVRVTEGQTGAGAIIMNNNTSSALRDGATVTAINGAAGGFTTDFSSSVNILGGASDISLTASYVSAAGNPTSNNFTIKYGDQHAFAGFNATNSQSATLTVNATVDKIAEHVMTTSGMAPDRTSGGSLGTANPIKGSNGNYIPGYVTNINGGVGVSKGYITVDLLPGPSTVFSPDDPIVLLDFGSSPNLTSLAADLTSFGYSFHTYNNLNGAGTGELSAFAGYDLELDSLATSTTNRSYVDFDFSKYNSGNLSVVNIAVVPEPTSLSLVGLGILGLMMSRRRRLSMPRPEEIRS